MADQIVKLDADEALVLFDWLSEREKQVVTADRDMTAEDIVLARLLGQLERVLVEPFAGDYAALLNAARVRIVG